MTEQHVQFGCIQIIEYSPLAIDKSLTPCCHGAACVELCRKRLRCATTSIDVYEVLRQQQQQARQVSNQNLIRFRCESSRNLRKQKQSTSISPETLPEERTPAEKNARRRSRRRSSSKQQEKEQEQKRLCAAIDDIEKRTHELFRKLNSLTAMSSNIFQLE